MSITMRDTTCSAAGSGGLTEHGHPRQRGVRDCVTISVLAYVSIFMIIKFTNMAGQSGQNKKKIFPERHCLLLYLQAVFYLPACDDYSSFNPEILSG